MTSVDDEQLHQLTRALLDPDLAQDIAEIQEQAEVYEQSAPASTEGKRAIKASKKG